MAIKLCSHNAVHTAIYNFHNDINAGPSAEPKQGGEPNKKTKVAIAVEKREKILTEWQDRGWEITWVAMGVYSDNMSLVLCKPRIGFLTTN